MNFLNPLNWLSGVKRMSGPLTWHELSRCPPGTRVRFSMKTVLPGVSIKESVVGIVHENELLLSTAMVFVKIDGDDTIAAMLLHYRGCVSAYAPSDPARWSEPSPFTVGG